MSASNQIPTKVLAADSRLKVHLRLVSVGGFNYRVITLRPGTDVAFSTNFYHQTWHIVTGQRGARLLARLLWGLSYQRHPGTLFLVHGSHLLPTPFEAERSDPFLLSQDGLTRLDSSALRALKDRLNRLGPPRKTIRWHSFGLDALLQARSDAQTINEANRQRGQTLDESLWKRERMRRLGGFICYSAPAPVLQLQALRVHALRVAGPAGGMDYHYLAARSSRDSWCDGEVQIFDDYGDRVAAAEEARRQLMPNPMHPSLSETMQEAISRQRDQIKARKARSRRAR